MRINIFRNHRRDGDTVLLGRCVHRSGSASPRAVVDETEARNSVSEVRSLVGDLNGHYALITAVESGWVLVADRIQSIPLYYSVEEGELVVSDRQEHLRNRIGGDDRDPVSVEEYRTLGYVTGPHTLDPAIKQTEAGTLVHFDGDRLTRSRHFEYRYAVDGERTRDELDRVVRRVFSRLAEVADGRPIWVPLSGGLDSRLVAAVLKRLGHSDLHAYSYGASGNGESAVSKRVAESLDIDWHFVEYTHERWQSWYRTEARREYDRSLELTTAPHLREWPAVKQLRDRGVLSEDAVIVPGHSGMPTGSHLIPRIYNSNYVTPKEIENTILSEFYPWNRGASDGKALRKRLRERTIPDETLSGKEASEAIERWDWSERQTKHIKNHVRPYDFWDVDWWMPLWDAELFEFWLGVPLDQRLGQTLYHQYIHSVYTAVAEDPVRTVDSADTAVDRLRNHVGDSSIRPLVEPLYRLYQSYARERSRFADDRAWDQPLCRNGVMRRETFAENFDGEHQFRAYRARERLGEISFG